MFTLCIILDFDDDGTLDSNDLELLVNCLTGETDDTRLTPEEMQQLIKNVSHVKHYLFLCYSYSILCILTTMIIPSLDSRRVRH